MNDKHLIVAVNAAITAGLKTLEFYNTNFNIEYKEDQSPLTSADKASHLIINNLLKDTNIPILSEEGMHTDYSIRKKWDLFWLIDPIDGTKEFINKNGDFTINIALIKNQKPIAGVIYVPVKNTLYVASEQLGSLKFDDVTNSNIIIDFAKGIKLPQVTSEKNIVVASRSHLNQETKDYINTLDLGNDFDFVSVGSSLKFCILAEGRATHYPRLGPTMEWDTAAGHAIALFAGCTVTKIDGTPLLYNKENLLNPHFLALR